MSQSSSTIALVGNPNCGKTTLFNALTGARQRVGNWPGVTVERKSGEYRHGDTTVEVIDLPGIYSLGAVGDAADERVAQEYLASHTVQAVINVVDASCLARGLYLTLELIAARQPVIVALNMMDVADRHGVHIDTTSLAATLGCPVVPVVASRREGIGVLKDAVETVANHPPSPLPEFADGEARYRYVDNLLALCTSTSPVRQTATQRLDAVLLNRLLAIPLFLCVMYLMFLFSINVGSAFIDLFDGVGNVLFVEGPRRVMDSIGVPEWLVVLLAEGVGGGMQLVATFIPVIGCLFLALSFLEDSGYIARAAFIVDNLMKRLGLPGKSFVPLIVGFGCNVPAVMATRTLDREPDRILTTIMAPYMSCGARLTVYALFAAAFFPSNGQNIVFGLYLIGIVVAILSALIVRRFIISSSTGHFVLELPPYHLPTLRGLLMHTWHRLKGFVVRAGKAIVIVVVVLNVLNAVGTDGSFGNQNSQKSVLSAVGKAITPAFAPLGIEEDNWPATVGIFTGVFAKEVVVGTLDALYTPQADGEQEAIGDLLAAALQSVPENLSDLGDQLADPLGLDLGDTTDLAAQAEQQEVQMSTVAALQSGFGSQLAAFSYLLFILLYMPCVATIGAIYKEIGAFWAVFSTTWSLVMAYSVATVVFQLGQLSTAPAAAAITIALCAAAAAAAFIGLVRWGRARQAKLIPLRQI